RGELRIAHCSPRRAAPPPGVVAGAGDAEHAAQQGDRMLCLLRLDQPKTSSPLIDLPREESRCLLQDLALLTQTRVVAPQPAQLLPLITPQPLALARVDLR